MAMDWIVGQDVSGRGRYPIGNADRPTGLPRRTRSGGAFHAGLR